MAKDGIAIIVNPNNPVADLSVEQIAQLATGEITNWADVGGTDGQVVFMGREAGSAPATASSPSPAPRTPASTRMS